MLFNNGIEHAMKKWKRYLDNHGILINVEREWLSNVRYADDILLFAKSVEEMQIMIDMLSEELLNVGLEMHPSKTKILTSCNPLPCHMVDAGDMMIEVLSCDKSHKYLGRLLNMDPSMRISIEARNRLNASWAKFHEHRDALCNHNVPIGLRLRLFDTIVTPVVLYGGAVLPLSQKDLEQLDIVQRRMLRLIVGWKRYPDESWEATMHRMKARVSHALQYHAIPTWSHRFHKNRWGYASHVIFNVKNRLPYLLAEWIPLHDPAADEVPHRRPGRPRLRWDDDLHDFCAAKLGLYHWTDIERFSKLELMNHEAAFIAYCVEKPES